MIEAILFICENRKLIQQAIDSQQERQATKMHNILTDRLFRVSYSDGTVGKSSLPEIFAALENVDAFPALRPHQRHPWPCISRQLGALAMHKSGMSQQPDYAASWQEIIRRLTASEFPDDEPWRLFVEDITKPAFLQPPANSAIRLVDYKGKLQTPDALDIWSPRETTI